MKRNGGAPRQGPASLTSITEQQTESAPGPPTGTLGLRNGRFSATTSPWGASAAWGAPAPRGATDLLGGEHVHGEHQRGTARNGAHATVAVAGLRGNHQQQLGADGLTDDAVHPTCLLYTSPSP